MELSFSQIGREVPSFADAAVIADKIITSGIEFDSVALIYNRFVSAIAYESSTMEIFNEKALLEARTPCLSKIPTHVLISDR